MTGSDVPDDDMLNSLWPSRTDVPPTGDAALDALLTPDQRPEDATGALRSVAEVLAALRAAPSGGELTGLDRALAAFRSGADLPEPVRSRADLPEPVRDPRPNPVGQAWRRNMLRLRLAVAVAVAAMAAFGAAAYAGVLPPALQKFAHDTIAAPQAKASHARRAGAGTGSHPTSAATYGLCNAYQRAIAHGNGRQKSVAFRNLARAAGGPGKVAAFCASVPKPGAASAAPGTPGTRGAGHTPPGKAAGRTSHTPPGQSGTGRNGGGNGTGNNGTGHHGGGGQGGGGNNGGGGGNGQTGGGNGQTGGGGGQGGGGQGGGGQGGGGNTGGGNTGGGHGKGGARSQPARPGKAQ